MNILKVPFLKFPSLSNLSDPLLHIIYFKFPEIVLFFIIEQSFFTSAFDKLEKEGVKAESLIPVFPSLTFPNHYSIATGSYAGTHNITGNSFYDKKIRKKYSLKNKETVRDAKFYNSEPIWVTAEKEGLVSATYFWVGSEAKIGGYYPTYYKNYQSGIDPEIKIKQVVDWLELPIQERPRLICLYFNEPDHAGHVYGSDSKEVNHQIELSDNIVIHNTEISTTKLFFINLNL